jgi:hypothetical protein
MANSNAPVRAPEPQPENPTSAPRPSWPAGQPKPARLPIRLQGGIPL